VRVISATEKVEDTPEGGLQEGLLEILSEYYVKDLARKVRRGMEGNALKAQDNGYRIFGYRTGPETRHYVIHEGEAACVREMFARHINGESVNSIARLMASRGWTTTTGKPVDYNWANRVLNRKAYTGLYSWGGIEVEGGMPQIIDEATFERSQAVVPKKRRANENWDEYRLTGKLFCGLCGKPMHGTAGTGKKGKRYHYYACKEGDGCGRPWVRRELVEDSIAQAVLDVTADEERMRLVARRIVEAYAEDDTAEAELETCEQEIAELEAEQHNLTKAAMRGFVNDETVARNEEIKSQLKSLHNRRGILESQRMELTEDDIVEYMAHGFDRSDEDFIFGSVVNKAYLFEDCVLIVFNFRDEVGDLAEIRAALEAQKKCEPDEGFALYSSGVGGGT
jgi:site-specific DNA recombinase